MYRIGVDLGGTNIAAGIVDMDGKIVAKNSVATVKNQSHDLLAKDIADLCSSVASKADLAFDKITSLGIGCPGTVNPPDGMLIHASNIGISNMPIGIMLNKFLNIPVFIQNDANCAALGEAAFGAAKDSSHSITITLGTGIGSGIIIDGKIYSGPFYGAGEMGHHVIHAGGEPCSCGRRGCWETYASATALVRETKVWAKRAAASEIGKMVNGDLSKVTAKTVFDAAGTWDRYAIEVVEVYIDNLCIGLANIVNIFQPEIIVIGGGVSGQGESLLDSINSRISDMVYGGDVKTEFAIAALGNDAGIVGAALLT